MVLLACLVVAVLSGCGGGYGMHAPPPTQAMIEQMIGQVVLEARQVEALLDVRDEPLRLWTVAELAQGAPSLRFAGRPVSVVATEAEAQLVFRSSERLGPASRVRVRFEVPARRASGHVDLELRDFVWRATDVVVER